MIKLIEYKVSWRQICLLRDLQKNGDYKLENWESFIAEIRDILDFMEDVKDVKKEQEPAIKYLFYDRIQALLYPKEEPVVQTIAPKRTAAQQKAYEESSRFWRKCYDYLEEIKVREKKEKQSF